MTNHVTQQFEPLVAELSQDKSAETSPPRRAAGHSNEEIVRIVLRGLCGYETVGDICRAEGITRNQYNKWRRDFVQACKDWTQQDNRSRRKARGAQWPLAGKQFSQLASLQAKDIIERADERLTTAWLVDKQMASRHFMGSAMP